MEKPRYSQKELSLRLRTFFSKRNYNTGFEISSVGILEHLMRHAKNGYDTVAIYSNTASRASKFLVGSATAAEVARWLCGRSLHCEVGRSGISVRGEASRRIEVEE